MTQPPERVNAEVYVARRDPLITVGPGERDFLRARVGEAPRHRVRLCTHGDSEDPFHEMFILLDRATYIRPHKHLGKVESFHVIEGAADAVFFDEQGVLTRIVALGDCRSGRCFYYRVSGPGYHTLILRSASLFFHEATTGPFLRESTVGAPWSPEEGDGPAIERFKKRLEEDVELFRQRHPEP